MKTIVVRWVEDDGMYGKEMRIVESDHERFSKGTRFDFGFFNIATAQGYTIISLPIATSNIEDTIDCGKDGSEDVKILKCIKEDCTNEAVENSNYCKDCFMEKE